MSTAPASNPNPMSQGRGSPDRGISLDRRALLSAAGTAAASLACAGAAGRASARETPQAGAAEARVARTGYPAMVGSANALPGMRQHYAALEAGSAPLDAAIEVVKVVEADPSDHSVGLGGLPNERGVVQLDAACMHGPTHNSGGVACIENILHPSEVARLVMERTDHCLLVGQGAYEFARAHGHAHTDLLTDEARRLWLEWKERSSADDDWLEPAPQGKELRTGRLEGPTMETALRLQQRGLAHTWGTIHCSALGANGDIACVTTTSGLSWKIPGRVGDSAIIGAGLYCDQEAGSAGSTGRGEAAVLANASFAIVEFLRRGASPREAGLEVLRRIVRQVERQAKWQPALRRADGTPAFNIHFYVLGLDGSYAGVALHRGGGAPTFAVATPEGGPRHEACECLLD
ncbi:MAG: N(4)-(beta-N-acetylglucosaminyl)-L-asparaginase [Planctomycetes bacterium]|nr:N(4)-(beta-N-acetylglucosaminyl)-L-asparaginase [Planctomycetota bacterium]